MSQVITWPLVIKQLNLRWQLSFVVFISSINSEIDNKDRWKMTPLWGRCPKTCGSCPGLVMGPLYIQGYKLKWLIKDEKTKPS